MKVRNGAQENGLAREGRDDMRELAELTGLYRSAMRHVAERQPERVWNVAEAGPAKSRRVRLLLVPALAAAVAAAVMLPMYSHSHAGSRPAAAAAVAQGGATTNAETRASVSDTALMNQVDSEVSEEVPDALQPLAELSEQATTTNSEKKNVTQN
jgi:hypothetical protein